jgi:ATP-binding cassette subfamily B protein
MTADLEAHAWPADRLGEALDALARQSGLGPRAIMTPSPPEGLSGEALNAWLDRVAAGLGIEVEAVDAGYDELIATMRNAGPALVALRGERGPSFIALLRGAQRKLSVLRPDLTIARLSPEVIQAALCQPLRERVHPLVERMLERVDITGRARTRAYEGLLRERLASARVGGIWLLRLLPGAPVARQARDAGLPRRLTVLVGAHLAAYVILLGSWWVIGREALSGQLDRTALLAWMLLIASVIPFRLLATWSAGLLAIDAGGVLKRRLLAGAVALEAEEIRHEGAGRFLGKVIESESVEALALSGGLVGLVAAVELAISGVILGLGAGGAWLPILLFAWVAASIVLGLRYLVRRHRWTDMRLEMTHDLVERMVGHRTRLAQEPRDRWHTEEDESLARYLAHSVELDRSHTLLSALVPRGWIVIGVLGMAPSFIAGSVSTPALAVSLGGVLLAYRALQSLVTGLSNLAGAGIAWREVAPLFQAASRAERAPLLNLQLTARGLRPGAPEAEPAAGDTARQRTLLEANEIVFRYPGRPEPALRGASLRIQTGDRLLIEGASGGGKTTLSAVLAGLRQPESGLLLLCGLDRRTLGAATWRRLVGIAPQFHENYVFTGTFAFNLLMGRRWPPAPEDLDEATALCEALDLGGLLRRMPAGLEQMVGESGWQLSHGERSRLYIARALLQGAELIVLDESFAALDPETMRRALECVIHRAPTLMVIAHP